LVWDWMACKAMVWDVRRIFNSLLKLPQLIYEEFKAAAAAYEQATSVLDGLRAKLSTNPALAAVAGAF